MSDERKTKINTSDTLLEVLSCKNKIRQIIK